VRISRIDHINITADSVVVERCRRFYVDVLGFTEGHRPSFASAGYWLYAADEPLVHLTVAEAHQAPGSACDHVAFACCGLEHCIERLQSAGVDFTRSHVPASRAVQLFLTDPSGLRLELQFAAP
jgi:catechol 2,3-dioxygenase-like lactoylglutathione lyase family enzyme